MCCQVGKFASVAKEDGLAAALRATNFSLLLSKAIGVAKKQVALPGIDAVGSVLCYFLDKTNADTQLVKRRIFLILNFSFSVSV